MTAYSPLRPFVVALGVAMLLASPVRAQEASLDTPPSATASSAVDTAAAPAGPTLTEASIAVRRAPVAATTPTAAAAGRSRDSGTALMIVGGAAVLTGIVIGNGAGYAISVAGAVVGLYGLYQYLQ